MTIFLLWVISTALSVCRVFGLKGVIFQAVAHLFIGGLVGSWLTRRTWDKFEMIIYLTIVEVLCFFLLK